MTCDIILILYYLVNVDRMAPKRTSTFAVLAITQAAIRKLLDSIVIALEAQAANMANIDNTNRNTEPKEAHVARKYSYKEFMSCQLSTSKVRKAMLDSSAGLNELNQYSPVVTAMRNVKKMEDEFYNLAVNGNDLKTYVRRFQELAVLCPVMVPNSEKMMKVFIGGLPRSIEGNVTASKPQTLEEAITRTQRLMDQVIKHNSMRGINDHKRKFDDRRTCTNNNNYHNNRNNNNRINDHHQQQNRRQDSIRAYAATQTENHGYVENFPCVEDVSYTTQDLAQSSVILATRWATRPRTTKTKGQPLE
nr:reverse transcriptase domain-containing protein [Tanacetum cinerariifolium]